MFSGYYCTGLLLLNGEFFYLYSSVLRICGRGLLLDSIANMLQWDYYMVLVAHWYHFVYTRSMALRMCVPMLRI